MCDHHRLEMQKDLALTILQVHGACGRTRLQEMGNLYSKRRQRVFLSVSRSSTHIELCLAYLSILADGLVIEYLDNEIVVSFFQSEFERFVPDKARWSVLVSTASCT
jgi:hypothetical protein